VTRDVLLVHGTWSRTALWHQPFGPLTRELVGRGFTVHQFKWTGILGGVRVLVDPLLERGDADEGDNGADQPELLLWLDAGEKLALFCQARGLARPHVLSHSHGLQVVTYAAVKGQRFAAALSVAGPVRDDMQRARRIARDGIDTWIQFYDPINDPTIRAGEALDGHPGFTGPMPEAAININTAGSGHSGLLIDPALRERYELWAPLAKAA
jgi:hypothetical protein